jgi:CubicO group peptidase (beta-lactamase class C family)
MNHTHRLIIIIALLACGAPAKAQPDPSAQSTAARTAKPGQARISVAQPDKSTQIRRLLADNHLPGIQLVYTRDAHSEVYNLGTTGDPTHPVTSNTIFEAASLSKCVFAYIVLRLYDRGRINLDTSLLAYLGTYPRFDSTDPRYARITARMVLHHTTGLPNWGDSAHCLLRFTPDSCFSYSGEGYMFLQRVVEKITGKTLEELAEQEVFTPLHMTGSSYVWQPRFDSVSAFGHSPDAIKAHSNAGSAFSLLTNAHDYTLFVQALAAGRGLKPTTHRMMLTPAVNAGWLNRPPTEATPHIHWGLGVGLQEDAAPGPAFWHWGDNGSFKAYYIVYPNTHETLVYFVHDYRGLFITQELCDLFFGKQPCWGILWSGEGYESPWSMKTFKTALGQQNFDNAAAIYDRLKQQGDTLSEHDLNEYGFLLLSGKRSKDAVAIFKLNLGLHPQSANAFDSLAEGYEASGEKALALENFKQSLQRNPKNDYAAEHIKKLQTSLQAQ